MISEGFLVRIVQNGILILLIAEILRSPVEGPVVYPIVYRVSAPSQVVVWDFIRQQ